MLCQITLARLRIALRAIRTRTKETSEACLDHVRTATTPLLPKKPKPSAKQRIVSRQLFEHKRSGRISTKVEINFFAVLERFFLIKQLDKLNLHWIFLDVLCLLFLFVQYQLYYVVMYYISKPLVVAR